MAASAFMTWCSPSTPKCTVGRLAAGERHGEVGSARVRTHVVGAHVGRVAEAEPDDARGGEVGHGRDPRVVGVEHRDIRRRAVR